MGSRKYFVTGRPVRSEATAVNNCTQVHDSRRLIDKAEALDGPGLILAEGPSPSWRHCAGLMPGDGFVAFRSMSRADEAVELNSQPNAKTLSLDELGQMAYRIASRPSEVDETDR